ncbi:MAG: alpha/beta fold hydrolase [Coxiella endosymbiont of Haemaphysalis qinghaiensis]
MLTMSSMAFISGWGFKSALLRESSFYLKNSFLLDLPNLLEELTLDRVTYNLACLIPDDTMIIGWSLGGLVAIQLATQFPKKVKKLILLSSSPCFIQGKGWSGISSAKAEKFVDLSKRNFANLSNYFFTLVNYPNKTTYYKNLLRANSLNFLEQRDLLLKYLKILFGSDIRQAYKRIKIPLFHVFGGRDAIVRFNPNELYDLNPGAVIYVIPEAGHLAFLTHEKSYYNQLVKFIKYA